MDSISISITINWFKSGAIQEIANESLVNEILGSFQARTSDTILERWKTCMLHSYYFYHLPSSDHRVKRDEADIMTMSRVYQLVHWLVQTENSPLRIVFRSFSASRMSKFDKIVSLLEAVPDTFKPVVMQQVLNNLLCSYAPSGISLLNWTPSMGSSCGDGAIDYMLLECGHVFQGVFGIPQQYDPEQKIPEQIELQEPTREKAKRWMSEFQQFLVDQFGPDGATPNSLIFGEEGYANTPQVREARLREFELFWNKKTTK
jgi:hypothetical protein